MKPGSHSNRVTGADLKSYWLLMAKRVSSMQTNLASIDVQARRIFQTAQPEWLDQSSQSDLRNKRSNRRSMRQIRRGANKSVDRWLEHSFALTQDLISIDRWSRIVNREIVIKGVPNVQISTSESW